MFDWTAHDDIEKMPKIQFDHGLHRTFNVPLSNHQLENTKRNVDIFVVVKMRENKEFVWSWLAEQKNKNSYTQKKFCCVLELVEDRIKA